MTENQKQETHLLRTQKISIYGLSCDSGNNNRTSAKEQWDWLKKDHLKKETESINVAAQDQATRTHNIHKHIHKYAKTFVQNLIQDEIWFSMFMCLSPINYVIVCGVLQLFIQL